MILIKKCLRGARVNYYFNENTIFLYRHCSIIAATCTATFFWWGGWTRSYYSDY